MPTKREARVDAGVAALHRWIEDLLRQGLARSANSRTWEQTAARMVDAQMPGAARTIRHIGRLMQNEDDWTGPVLDRIARLVLLCQAWPRRETLDAASQADVRTAIGFTQSQEALLLTPGVSARWQVVGQFTQEEEQFRIQRTWLAHGPERALLLDFSRYEAPHDASLMPGTEVDAEIVYYPGTVPQRALLKNAGPASPLEDLGGDSVADGLRAWQRAVCRNPWLELGPMVLREVVPLMASGRGWVQDNSGRIALQPGFDGMWQLLARSGGRPVSLAGEWNGTFLRPLGGVFDGEYRRF